MIQKNHQLAYASGGLGLLDYAQSIGAALTDESLKNKIKEVVVNGLALAGGPTLLVLAFIYLPVLSVPIIRLVLGAILVTFVPGYTLVSALFPHKSDIDGTKRVLLSFGMSIAIILLVATALNYTAPGISLETVSACLAIFIALCGIIAYRRRSDLGEDWFFTEVYGAYHRIRGAFKGQARLDSILTIFLILSILVSAFTVGYVLFAPRQEEKFTEFYILGPNGKSTDYPGSFIQGDSRPVIVGIMNHEYSNMTYDLIIGLNDSANVTRLYAERIALSDGEAIEKTINVSPDRSGTHMKLEFLLYHDGNMTAPYRELHLWIDVAQPA